MKSLTTEKNLSIQCLTILLLLSPFTASNVISNANINSQIMETNWFDGSDRLIWMENNRKIIVSSDLSYGPQFLFNKKYVFSDYNNLIHFDNVNYKIYLINSQQQNVTIIRYDLTDKTAEDLYFCTKLKCNDDVSVLMNCSANTCPLYVDGNINIMYFGTPFGFFYLDLNTLSFNQFAWSKTDTYKYNSYGKLAVYDNYLYFVANGIGILRKQLLKFEAIINTDLPQIFIDKKAFNNQEITSFAIDISRNIMYFSTNHHIYYFKINLHASNSSFTKIELNINKNALQIHSLEINHDGTMLFIQYSIKQRLYAINWPTSFGCILCKSTGKLLNSVSGILFYYPPCTLPKVSEALQSHASARKLLSVDLHLWYKSDIKLLRPDRGVSVGYYNNSIFIIGGTTYDFQVTEYDIINNVMIDHGENTLHLSTTSPGQQYYQLNHENLILMPVYGASFSIYNMKTNTFQGNWRNISVPNGLGGCITGINDYIFTPGGNALGVLNVLTNEWLLNAPSLKYSRRHDFSCNVHPDTMSLYAIGGAADGGPNNYRTIVEKVYVGGNISNETWKQLGQPILPSKFHKSLVFGDSILIMGGSAGAFQRSIIQTINCTSDQIVQNAGNMNYPVWMMGAIILPMHNRIYTFGGEYSNMFYDTWQYSILEPTSAPTSFPTVSPTIPSRSPTGAPTCLYYNSSFFNAYYHKVVIRDHQMLKQTPYINSTGKEHKYTFQTITCSNNTNKANECYIECLDKESCMESIFKPINQLSILSILCGDEKSCKQLNLITN
eukprot:88734_1